MNVRDKSCVTMSCIMPHHSPILCEFRVTDAFTLGPLTHCHATLGAGRGWVRARALRDDERQRHSVTTRVER